MPRSQPCIAFRAGVAGIALVALLALPAVHGVHPATPLHASRAAETSFTTASMPAATTGLEAPCVLCNGAAQARIAVAAARVAPDGDEGPHARLTAAERLGSPLALRSRAHPTRAPPLS